MLDLRTLSPITSLPWMLGALRMVLASLGGRRLMEEGLAFLLHRRVGEICGRLERMLARFAAGRSMVRGARVGVGGARAAVEVVPRAGVSATRNLVWPLGFGWGLRVSRIEAVRLEVASVGGHLRVILQHPEMVALLRASASARRLLSPVCRMLGVEGALLRPVVPGEVLVVKPVRVRKKRGVVEKLPPLVWPRGVLAMVRKYKKLGTWMT